MKIKKISIAIILIAVITTLLTVNVQATSITGGLLGSPGDEVVVYLRLSGTSVGLIGAQGKISYDKEKLELLSCKSALTTWRENPTFNDETGIFVAEIDDIDNEAGYIKSDTNVVKFTFKIKDSITTSGTANVKIEEMKTTDSNFDTGKPANISANITIMILNPNIKPNPGYVPDPEDPNPWEEGTKINSEDKTIQVPPGTTPKDFLDQVDIPGEGTPGKVTINGVDTDKDPNDKYIGTGDTITIKQDDGSEITYTFIVKYDVTGDGYMNTADIWAMRYHIVKSKLITNPLYLQVADANEDGDINVSDLLLIRKAITHQPQV